MDYKTYFSSWMLFRKYYDCKEHFKMVSCFSADDASYFCREICYATLQVNYKNVSIRRGHDQIKLH